MCVYAKKKPICMPNLVIRQSNMISIYIYLSIVNFQRIFVYFTKKNASIQGVLWSVKSKRSNEGWMHPPKKSNFFSVLNILFKFLQLFTERGLKCTFISRSIFIFQHISSLFIKNFALNIMIHKSSVWTT